jgi:two-component system phosphate regulon sensor histidine kinase PhoR
MKNPTPRVIAALSAAVISIIAFLAAYLMGFGWSRSLLLTLIVFISGYLIYLIFLENFIYRKIKLIYKIIHRFKTQKEELTFKEKEKDPISEVTDEVMAWAKDYRTEIDKLKKQENFRKEFLGNVSHELRTPIANLQGYIHTLLDGALEDQNVNRPFLERASDSADRLEELVKDLTSISMLEVGELKMNPEKFDIHELALAVYKDLEMNAVEKKVELKFKEGCNKPFFVTADRSRIHQVLTNLISNAIKYGKENGHVLTGFYDMDKNLLIEITDNGGGIEKEHLPRLFERFYRVDRHRDRSKGGSGLGLAIVKHIIEAHRQTINVRSTPGVGTTFGFTLNKA